MTTDAAARGAGARRACRASPSSASRPRCRSGIRRRSCAPCWSSGCASSKCGSARTSCSATIAPAPSSVLRTLGARYGFRAEKIDPVRYKDFVVSSTRIRRLVAEGRVDEAGALLGHHYFIDGTVVARRRARARARVSRPRTCETRQRAAAAGGRLRDDRGDQRRRASVGDEHRRCVPLSATSIALQVETHLLDVDRDLYDARVRLSFVQRLRDERAFPGRRRPARADRRRLPGGPAAVRPHFAIES